MTRNSAPRSAMPPRPQPASATSVDRFTSRGASRVYGGVGVILALVAMYLVATRTPTARLPERVPSPQPVAPTPSGSESHAAPDGTGTDLPSGSGSAGSVVGIQATPPTSRRVLLASPELASAARARGLEVAHAEIDGEPALRLVAGPGQGGVVELPLPTHIRLLERQTLVLRMRAVSPTDALDLRLLAIDANGRTIFQRRFTLASAPGWVEVAEPFRGWRWGDTHSGSWAEVVYLGLVLPRLDRGATVALAWLDVEPGSGRDLGFQLAPLMQADGPTRFIQRDHLLVGTDLPDAIDEATLEVLAARLRPIDPWLRRLFGDAVRPTELDRPIPFLVFASPERRAAFFVALGKTWNVAITPSRAGGYTVQDIATSDWLPAKGVDRPVYVHEAVHAIAARLLRVNPGVGGHGWLQEGLANYLQLALHPASMDPKEYAREFSQPIQATGRGWFRPLAMLLAKRVETTDYPQLASLAGYLIERQAGWLPALARGVADGKPLPAILHGLGTDIDALEAGWFAWGKERHAGPRPADAPHFPRPLEWAGK